MQITLTSSGSHTKRRHRFQLQQVPPAVSVATCEDKTEIDLSSSTYDGRNLVQNVFLTAHSTAACVEGVRSVLFFFGFKLCDER